jgi:hypothetical protein
LLLFLSLTLPGLARAEIDLQFSGRLQTDLRARITQKSIGQWYDRLELARGISRNENIAKLRLEANAGRFFGVADLDFVWIGIQRDVEVFSDVLQREKVDSYRLEAHAIYAEVADLLTPGLDLRVGQQKVSWGKGDQFNPTNTINANDLEDQLLFGEQMANAMVRLDYAPGEGQWTVSAVLVPVFKPALLPETAMLGLADLSRLPFAEQQLRQRIHAEQALARDSFGYPTQVSRASIVLPETRLDNMQAALRVAGTVAEQDIALSYYVGRSDMPQPFLNYSYISDDPRCASNDPTDCIKGSIETEVSMFYPRMHVVGLNAAGQMNLLGWLSSKIRPIGYRLEAALIFPQKSTIALLQEQILTQPAGEYDYELGDNVRPVTIPDTPFAKWVVGLDYTFSRHLYTNLQWVHGLVDEFGAGDFINEGWSVRSGGVAGDTPVALCAVIDEERGRRCARELLRPRIGDYLVLGIDIKLLSDKLLGRLFMIFDLNGITEELWDPDADDRVRIHHSPFSAEGFSAVVFPEVTYNFGRGFELSGGALLKLGKSHTKFGDPAAGGSEVWTRARFSF